MGAGVACARVRDHEKIRTRDAIENLLLLALRVRACERARERLCVRARARTTFWGEAMGVVMPPMLLLCVWEGGGGGEGGMLRE